MATETGRREPYIGEKHKFLRNGYGVYVYENQFFRYEGEWKSGKKHGHGKLLMKDGTYYEGQFVNGEINGHGYKYFSGSGCKYTGQFLNGEMHGHGVMQYCDESVYEGQWHKNKKQGFGILRTSVKAVYEGIFEGHHRQGEGTQTYDNGDRYEGYWVMDKRHGHGELFCADGSYYIGQFCDDMYHGEGKMQHSSGMIFAGQWLHGFPTRLATKFVIVAEESPLTIRQGHPFRICVRCLDDDDNDVTEDQGREIQVTAGFKYFPPKQGSVLFDMIEDVEEKPIPTPFGYEVVSYPLTDQLGEQEVVEDDKDKSLKEEDADEKGEGDGDGEGDGGEQDGGEDDGKDAAGQGEEADTQLPGGDAVTSNAGSPSQEPGAEAPPDGSSTVRPITPVEATPLPPPVATKRTEGGFVEWTNLQLSPPPPLYRPFVAIDEEKKSNKKLSLKEKFEIPEHKVSMELCVELPVKAVASKTKSGELKLKKKKSVGQTLDANASLTLEKRGSTIKLGDSMKEKTVVADEKFARTESATEAPLLEIYTEPLPGEYVLMVHDVTTPPFLGKRLEPAFLLLKLKKPKKIIVKKPKRVDNEDSEDSEDGNNAEC